MLLHAATAIVTAGPRPIATATAGPRPIAARGLHAGASSLAVRAADAVRDVTPAAGATEDAEAEAASPAVVAAVGAAATTDRPRVRAWTCPNRRRARLPPSAAAAACTTTPCLRDCPIGRQASVTIARVAARGSAGVTTAAAIPVAVVRREPIRAATLAVRAAALAARADPTAVTEAAGDVTEAAIAEATGASVAARPAVRLRAEDRPVRDPHGQESRAMIRARVAGAVAADPIAGSGRAASGRHIATTTTRSRRVASPPSRRRWSTRPR